jgi:hypothetical protein
MPMRAYAATSLHALFTQQHIPSSSHLQRAEQSSFVPGWAGRNSSSSLFLAAISVGWCLDAQIHQNGIFFSYIFFEIDLIPIKFLSPDICARRR